MPLGKGGQKVERWGIDFARVSDRNARVIALEENLYLGCRDHPSILRSDIEDGVQQYEVAVGSGVFVPLRLSPWDDARLTATLSLCEVLWELESLERTVVDDEPCDERRQALRDRVADYEAKFGKLDRAREVASVGRWTDWKVLMAIEVLESSPILSRRTYYPPPDRAPVFTDGTIAERASKACYATFGIQGQIDIGAIGKSANAEELGRDDLERLLLEAELIVPVPVFDAPSKAIALEEKRNQPHQNAS